jgi:hypothetical protein
MVHSYGVDSRASKHKPAALVVTLVNGVFVVLAGGTIINAFRHGVGPGVGVVGVIGGIAWAVYHARQGVCREIRLSDEGTCELETGRRVILLHVNQINAVEYDEDPETGHESYKITYRGGRVGLHDGIADLNDFCARLNALNPAVDLSSCPGWQSAAGAESSSRGVMRVVGSALFPLFVVIMIATIAWVTVR